MNSEVYLLDPILFIFSLLLIFNHHQMIILNLKYFTFKYLCKILREREKKLKN